MAPKIRDWIVTNWPIKLTALVLSALLWVAIAAQEPTTQVVPVQLELQPPEGRQFTQPVPQVQALFAGAARELFKLSGQPPVIQQTIPDSVSETYTLALSPADLKVVENADVNAEDITPRTITVYLDKYGRRRVTVVPRVTVLPESGFAQFGEVAVSPSAVRIRGPDALVRQIRSLFTVPLELSGVTAPVERTVAIDTSPPALRGIRLTRRAVALTVDVGPVAQRVLIGVPVMVRSAQEGGGAWEVDPPEVNVTVSGPSDRVARLELDSVQVVAIITVVSADSAAQLADTVGQLADTVGQLADTVAQLADTVGQLADTVGQLADSVAQLEVTAPPGITARAAPDSVIVRRSGRD